MAQAVPDRDDRNVANSIVRDAADGRANAIVGDKRGFRAKQKPLRILAARSTVERSGPS
jgi:hypothetical protein